MSEVIDMIEARGMYPPKRRFPFSLSSNTANGTDNRSKLLNEILNTERKYINSLEDLQVCYIYINLLLNFIIEIFQ